MQRLTLPRPHDLTPFNVSRLCFGAGSLGSSVTGTAAERLVGAFLDAGGNFFDTAHCYAFWTPAGAGCSERELGRVLRALKANDTVVMTKGAHPAMDGYPRPDHFLSPTTIRSDIDESRERLGVETIDLWLLHRDDGVTPVGEVLETLAAEVKRGAVRHVGASNWSVERLAEAGLHARTHGLPEFVVSEIQGSLAIPNWQPTADPTTRYLDDATLAWHQRSGLPLIAYSATAGGYFAGNPAADALYDNQANRQRRDWARQHAAKQGTTPTQVALAHLLALPATVIPLFGTSDPDHLAEILAVPHLADNAL